MDRDEIRWAIADVKSEKKKAIALVVELTIVLNELNKQLLCNKS